MQKLFVNQPAPEFELPGSDGQCHRLDQYRGQWLILFFYPRDDTPGCTIEACQLRDGFDDIRRLGGVVLGINTNSVQSHRRFVNKRRLPFPLLSDANGEISQRYGCLFKLGPVRFCKRHSFIIDPEGKLAKIYRRVSPSAHTAEIIEFLKQSVSQ